MYIQPKSTLPNVKPEKTVRIRDKQNADIIYPVHWKRAGYLVSAFPSRFEFEDTLQSQVYNGYAEIG